MVKYRVEYESIVCSDAIIDGTYLPDLKGWPVPHSFDLPAKDDNHAVQLTKDWYSVIGFYLTSQHRYMIGEPHLLKITTIDWRD